MLFRPVLFIVVPFSSYSKLACKGTSAGGGEAFKVLFLILGIVLPAAYHLARARGNQIAQFLFIEAEQHVVMPDCSLFCNRVGDRGST